jgi:hypothetical protein
LSRLQRALLVTAIVVIALAVLGYIAQSFNLMGMIVTMHSAPTG